MSHRETVNRRPRIAGAAIVLLTVALLAAGAGSAAVPGEAEIHNSRPAAAGETSPR